MSRPYTTCTRIAASSVLARRSEGHRTDRLQNNWLNKGNVEELCSRARRKQRRIEKGYIRTQRLSEKTPATQEQLQNNRIVEFEMKVELLRKIFYPNVEGCECQISGN